MKFKLIFAISFTFLCFMLLSTSAFAMPESDIEIKVTSPVNSLVSESGVVTVEQFPAEVTVNTTAKVGTLTEIQIAFNGNIQDIGPNHTFFIGNKEACGVYTITAKTDNGAVLTISANVVFQVKATCDVRYRTLAINLKEVYDDQDRRIKVFPSPQRIELANAYTIAGHERERIAELVGRRDGKTYTLKGSLVVEVYNHATGNVIGTYDVDRDFDSLTTSFHWTPKTLIAFETMRNAAISYQAPVKINVGATWCSENKQEVYGKLTAQDKGVPEYLYPYKTASVTFSKDDIPLSRNFIYKGLEWDYTPETAAYTDGESQTQTSITQRINCRIPAADFYFKFKKQDADDLSVTINAPATVYRGDSYSFDVTFTNNGTQPAYDVPLKGKVDDALIKEIPDTQDFAPNESKTYTIKRKAGTSANVKTLTGVKLANMLSQKKKDVVLLFCDPFVPVIPVILPYLETGNRSLGNVLSSAEITQDRIFSNCLTLKKNSYLALLGYHKGENVFTYPDYTKSAAVDLLIQLRHIADYVIIDCTSHITADILSTVALEIADAVLRLGSCDLKGVSYFASQLPLLFERRFNPDRHTKILSNFRSSHPKAEIRECYGGTDFELPYVAELEEQYRDRTLYNLVTEAFPIVMFVKKLEDKTRKIMEITECEILPDGSRKIRTLFRFNVSGNQALGDGVRVIGEFEKVCDISENLQKRLLENGMPKKTLAQFITGGGSR